MRLAGLFLLVLVMTSAACGPAVGGVQILNADIALGAAKTAGAEQYAVYEFTAAREYLDKAREELGYSDFSAARIYSDKALDYAQRARKKAEAASKAEAPPVESASPPPAP